MGRPDFLRRALALTALPFILASLWFTLIEAFPYALYSFAAVVALMELRVLAGGRSARSWLFYFHLAIGTLLLAALILLSYFTRPAILADAAMLLAALASGSGLLLIAKREFARS